MPKGGEPFFFFFYLFFNSQGEENLSFINNYIDLDKRSKIIYI